MIELKIGETITIKCVEGAGCDKCCFHGACYQDLLGGILCYKDERSDRKDVHFEIVEKPTEEDYTEQMRQLNEEWQENMKIQRAMLIDKACEWLAVSGVFNGNTCGDLKRYIENFRKAMEE